jgi:hypothetical protein
MTDKDHELDESVYEARRREHEEAELEEWRQWAESWINEVDEEYGAGEEGTDEVVGRYKRDTPGQ